MRDKEKEKSESTHLANDMIFITSIAYYLSKV